MSSRHALLPLALSCAVLSFSANAEAARGLQIRDLATLDRYSAPTLSPNGRMLVFARRVVDFAANKSSTALWVEDLTAAAAPKPKYGSAKRARS